MIVRRHTDSEVAGFVQRDDYEDLARRGPLTPDHIIRTKRFPMVGASQDSLDLYVQEYESYVEEFRHRVRTEFTEIDPAPRIVLDPEIGMLTAGFTAKDAQIAADIYHHTIPVLCRSEDHLGGYKALSAEELFDVEYWDLEQAKLRKSGKPPELSGTVSLVTGAASGIGKSCAEELKRLGSAVIGVDLNPEVNKVFVGDDWVGVEADVQYAERIAEATEDLEVSLQERIDSYLEYVAEEWLTENELAVEAGLKTEMTESFLGGMKDLFEEHYVEIPEDKYDVLESMVEKLDDMEKVLK